MQGRALTLLKWIWLTLVLIGLAWFFSEYDWRDLIQGRRLWTSLLSVCAVMVAHAGVVITQGEAIAANGLRLNWRTNLRIFNLTNLSKYIPFSGANLAVNGVMINRAGLSAGRSTRALLLATFWTVAGAFAFGAPAAAVWIGWPAWTGACLGAAGMIILAAVRPERWLGICCHYRPWRQLAGQLLIWTGYGTMFALILWPWLEGPQRLLAASAYDLSFGVGLLAVFAPSGVGVREVVTGWVFPDLAFDVVVAATLFARLVILVADLLFGGLAGWLTRTRCSASPNSSRRGTDIPRTDASS